MSVQVPKGYKQTEVGVIPEDWEVCPLGNIIKLQRGFDLPHRLRVNGDFPIITSSGYGGLHHECRVKGPGVVTGRYGTIGELFYIKEDFWPLNTTLYVKDFYENNSLFISYFLKQVDFASHSGKSGVPGVNRNDLHEIIMAFPKENKEQQAIAEALSDADALIESLEQLIAKKRQIKQGAMQELLTGQRRLPGFSEEWVEIRLGKVAEFFKGKGLPKSHIVSDGSDACIHYGELFTQYPEIVSEIFSRTNGKKDAFRSLANDVLMPTSDVTPRGLAKASCVCIDGVILGGDILVIRPNKNELNGSFLSYLIRQKEGVVLNLVTGSTVFHLYGSDMKRFIFRMPPIAEQNEIVAVLASMNAEIAALENRLSKARQIKQSMMQKLLTGRIRLI